MSESGLPSVEEVARVLPTQLDVLDVVYGKRMAYSGHEIATARLVLALFEAAVPRIKAEALREVADDEDAIAIQNGYASAGIGWLRDRADRIEAGQQ